MEVKTSGRHVEVTDAIRDYAGGKVARLPRYFDRIQRVDVVVDKKDRTHEVEIQVHVDRTEPFMAKVAGQDLYACIDSAVDKLERQLTDHKKKLRNSKGRTSMSG
jgi:putative sigma-54 modulation protein